jgi:hypothetical protein
MTDTSPSPSRDDAIAHEFYKRFGGDFTRWQNSCTRINGYWAAEPQETATSWELYAILASTCEEFGVSADLQQLFETADFAALLRRVHTLETLRNPLAPAVPIEELGQQLSAFLDYQKEEGTALISTGLSSTPFMQASWLDYRLRALYPTRMLEEVGPSHQTNWQRYVDASAPSAAGIAEEINHHRLRRTTCEFANAHLRPEFQDADAGDDLTGVSAAEVDAAFRQSEIARQIDRGRNVCAATRWRVLTGLVDGIEKGEPAPELANRFAAIFGVRREVRDFPTLGDTQGAYLARSQTIKGAVDWPIPDAMRGLAGGPIDSIADWVAWDLGYWREDDDACPPSGRERCPGGLLDLIAVVAEIVAERLEGTFSWVQLHQPAEVSNACDAGGLAPLYLVSWLASSDRQRLDAFVDDFEQRQRRHCESRRLHAVKLFNSIAPSDSSVSQADIDAFITQLRSQLPLLSRTNFEGLRGNLDWLLALMLGAGGDGATGSAVNPPATDHEYVFIKKGEGFLIRFKNDESWLADMGGLRYIQLLIASKPETLSPLKLIAAAAGLGKVNASKYGFGSRRFLSVANPTY